MFPNLYIFKIFAIIVSCDYVISQSFLQNKCLQFLIKFVKLNVPKIYVSKNFCPFSGLPNYGKLCLRAFALIGSPVILFTLRLPSP